MSQRSVGNRRLRKGAFAAALLFATACGGPKKSVEEEAQEAPPPPRVAAGATAAQRRTISASAKSDFASAAKKWEAMKEGGWAPSKCKDAASLWGSLADDNPDMVEARYDQGVAYEKCNMLDKAEDAYQQALKQNPRYAPALANLGEIYWRGGNAQVAEQYFQQAKAADPKNVTARNDLALMSLEKAEQTDDATARAALIKQATDDLHAALAVDGSNMVAYTTLAQLYYVDSDNDRSKLDLARLVCEQAKNINDKWAPIYNMLGLIWLKQKNVSAALAMFKKAVAIEPDYVEANMNIGAITLSFRDYQTAEGAFRQVLGQKPQDFEALVGLGVALRGESKIDDAEKEYLAAQAVNKDDPSTYYNLGLLYQDYRQSTADQLKRAKDYFQAYLDHDQGRNGDEEKEAQRRMGIIDDTLAALAQAAQAEAQAKAQAAQQAAQQPASAPAPAPAPATAAPAPAPSGKK